MQGPTWVPGGNALKQQPHTTRSHSTLHCCCTWQQDLSPAHDAHHPPKPGLAVTAQTTSNLPSESSTDRNDSAATCNTCALRVESNHQLPLLPDCCQTTNNYAVNWLCDCTATSKEYGSLQARAQTQQGVNACNIYQHLHQASTKAQHSICVHAQQGCNAPPLRDC